MSWFMEKIPSLIKSRFLDACVLLRLELEINLHLEVEGVHLLHICLAKRVGNYMNSKIMKFLRVEM